MGVPDREDFAPSTAGRALLAGCRGATSGAAGCGPCWPAPASRRRSRSGSGPRSLGDLGAYKMEDMDPARQAHVGAADANWKVVIDGFNENYHAAHLHTISPQDVQATAGSSTYFAFGRNGDDGGPVQGRAAGTAATRSTTRAWRSATTRSSRRRCSTTIRTTSSCSGRCRSRVDRPGSRRGNSGTRTATTGVPRGHRPALGAAEEGRGRGRRDLSRNGRAARQSTAYTRNVLQQPRMQDHALPRRRAGHARRGLRGSWSMSAPNYVAGIDFNAAVREDAFDVMGRLVEHYRNKSTDQADEQWREPVSNYSRPGAVANGDPDRPPQGAAAAGAVVRDARIPATTRRSTSWEPPC